jgi:mannose-6-phosphate isomerase-like protein (cupin superfamily)
MNKVNLAEKLALFSDHWKPKVVGELNGQQVRLKAQGEFCIVPRGVEHKPVAVEEVSVLLLEHERTVEALDRI